MMRKFDYAVKEIVGQLEDLAGELFDNAEVQAYFKEHYKFDVEYDDGFCQLVKFIEDRYC